MKVKCIDDKDSFGDLCNGQVYEVAGDNGNEYKLVDINNYWLHSRFEVVSDIKASDIKDGDWVECVDADHSSGEMVKGQTYRVLKVREQAGSFRYEIEGIPGSNYLARRFRFLRSSSLTTTITKPSVVASSKTDAEEDRCWKAMRPHVPDGYCPCGIHQSMCDYHRP